MDREPLVFTGELVTNNLEIKFTDHKLAFTEALRRGVFTRATVGDYMYMYTDPIKGDAFKHKWTKEYIYNCPVRPK